MVETRRDLDLVKLRIKTLYGGPTRVLLAEWILERSGEEFYQLEAQSQLYAKYAIALTATAQELKTFVSERLLAESPTSSRTYYNVLPSAHWAAYEEILKAVRSAG